MKKETIKNWGTASFYSFVGSAACFFYSLVLVPEHPVTSFVIGLVLCAIGVIAGIIGLWGYADYCYHNTGGFGDGLS